MAQKTFKAKITTDAGGPPVEVTVSAHNAIQAKKMIALQYGPVKIWYVNPQFVR